MKKQLITALSVIVFVVGIGSFGYLLNGVWWQTHPTETHEIRDITPKPYSSSASTESSDAMGTSDSENGITIQYAYEPWSRTYAATDPSKQLQYFWIYDSDESTVHTLTGSARSGTAKVVVTYTPEFGDARDADVYALKDYKPGNATWKYSYGKKLGNMRDGMNEYTVRTYNAEGNVTAQSTVVAVANKLDGMGYVPPKIDTVTLDVEWKDPVRRNVVDILALSGDADRYVHAYILNKSAFSVSTCGMGTEEPISIDSLPTAEEARAEMGREPVYEVGTVRGGTYAGARVFVHQGASTLCAQREAEYIDIIPYHFILATDGSIMNASAPQYQESLVTRNMPWDGKSIVDGSGPDAVSIDNSGVRLLECVESFCKTSVQKSGETIAPTPGFSRSERPVYQGQEGCFLVKRNDGFMQDYRVDIKMGNIQWLDGKTVGTVYTPDPVTGGCGHQPRHCHYVYDGNPAELERVGTTEDGLEVYQEKITPAELVAMSSGSSMYVSGAQTLYELFWSMAKYGENENITPAQFVARHPAVYVKDPLGRLVYFQGEQFGPAVECGKPVIYLYPEHTTDVSVKVAPTGGFTVTDPPYNDGWSVRATPESELFNYADGKTYPYLFWEGHGDEYTRPTKGFVASRADVPALLKEKLALLGLNDKESADFMEFWEPRLKAKPYVFVTFVDQPTFDTIAPLTVEPTPDTVIRVFMDYEPLDAPIAVDPLPIVTPKRTGFSVVEWGGALHPGDRGMCAAGTLLQ